MASTHLTRQRDTLPYTADRSVRIVPFEFLDALVPTIVDTRSLIPGGHVSNVPQKSALVIRIVVAEGHFKPHFQS
ncbi:hypothetical protein L2K20_14105 [Mycobacterium sp. MBM]|nr:hypothetical protein [Mycobacterium sp. MBM]